MWIAKQDYLQALSSFLCPAMIVKALKGYDDSQWIHRVTSIFGAYDKVIEGGCIIRMNFNFTLDWSTKVFLHIVHKCE